jgi:hypothetical protein|eukprot:COSAG01_NODE_3266_length_6332_cov_3.741377_2_plen_43_part_00
MTRMMPMIVWIRVLQWTGRAVVAMCNNRQANIDPVRAIRRAG